MNKQFNFKKKFDEIHNMNTDISDKYLVKHCKSFILSLLSNFGLF